MMIGYSDRYYQGNNEMALAPSLNEQPVVKLSNWAIIELESGIRFFIGREEGHEDKLRTSTPIREFDNDTMTGFTQSGRVYNLVGEPRENPLEDFDFIVLAAMFRIDPRTVSVIEVVRPSPALH